MAVIQISKIQVRRGLEEDLPQLSAGEFGWATDTRKLYIGNGVIGSPDYAPEIGNTEVLTVYAADALEVRVDALEANVANIQSNVSTLQSSILVNTITLPDNTTANTSITIGNIRSAALDYNIIRGTTLRTGTISVNSYNGSATFQDDYVENSDTGVSLIFVSNVANVANVSLQYTTSNISQDATFNYYIRSFI